MRLLHQMLHRFHEFTCSCRGTNSTPIMTRPHKHSRSRPVPRHCPHGEQTRTHLSYPVDIFSTARTTSSGLRYGTGSAALGGWCSACGGPQQRPPCVSANICASTSCMLRPTARLSSLAGYALANNSPCSTCTPTQQRNDAKQCRGRRRYVRRSHAPPVMVWAPTWSTCEGGMHAMHGTPRQHVLSCTHLQSNMFATGNDL